MEHEKLRYYPITLFSSVMGFAAVTIAVSQLETIYQHSPILSGILLTLTSLWFLLNTGILLFRITRYRGDVQKDFNHPVKMNFFAAVSISLLLLAMAYVNIFPSISFSLWIIGAVLQLSLTLIFLTKLMWNPSVQIAQFTPVSFIPIVGNLVVPIAGSFHVSADVNWLFFGIGSLFSIVYMTLIFQRLFFHAPLPQKLVPTLFILLAPPSVGYIAYVNISGGIDIFAYILYGIAFFFGLFLLFQLKRIFSGSFSIPAWSLLFPSGAFTIATIRMYRETGLAYYEWLYFAQMFGLLILVIYLTWQTFKLIRKGILCLPEA